MAKFEMNDLFESMDITEDKKVSLTEAFDAAVLVKTTELLDEHVETKVAEKVEVLEEEYKEKVELLEDSLDGYLDQVVEEFIVENSPSYEAQIADEKTKTLLELFDNMIQVVGVDMLTINEGKEERDANADATLEEQNVSLEERIADLADKLVDSKREANKYLQAGIVAETSEGLSILESDKFEKLAEMVPFERSESFLNKLEVIKESIIDARIEGFEEISTPAGALPAAAFKQPEAVNVKDATDFSKYI